MIKLFRKKHILWIFELYDGDEGFVNKVELVSRNPKKILTPKYVFNYAFTLETKEISRKEFKKWRKTNEYN